MTHAPATESNCVSPHVTPVEQFVDDPVPPLLHVIQTKKDDLERYEEQTAALLARASRAARVRKLHKTKKGHTKTESSDERWITSRQGKIKIHGKHQL